MGRKTAKLSVTAELSNHLDEQDDIDARTWQDFLVQVRALAARDEFADIDITVRDEGAV